ncbi:MAG: hypothetical protein WCO57_15225 [Verrucomicrobiota bacterium]
MKTGNYRRLLTVIALILLLMLGAWVVLRSGSMSSVAASPQRRLTENRYAGNQNAAHEDLVRKRLKLLEDMRKADPNYELKVPIDFFGKVLDQHDKPVIRAEIEIRLNVADEKGHKNHSLVSQADGTFELTGIRGKLVFVDIYSVEGYTCGEKGHRGSYNYAIPEELNFHVPDPNQPVIFRLWKYEKAEPIHFWQLAAGVKTDGTAVWFDLDRGEVGGAGLGVSIVDEMPGNKNEERHTIKVLAGSGCMLAATKDDPMFSAPEQMDQQEITVVHTAKNGYYNSGPGIFRFYYRSAQGKYAAVKAEVSSGSNGAKLVIFQNPSGSRNLEFDPALEIKK